MKILFVTWDGPQVSYLEGLFLPIFEKLTENGINFYILQFTWGSEQRIEESHKACSAAGIGYQAKIVMRYPVAIGSLLTAFRGAYLIRKIIRENQIDVVMPRSTLPALATLLALRGNSLPMIFDADGLPLDERVDFAGQSPSSLIYRILRDVEAQAVRRANVVLTRSRKAVTILHARAGAGTVVEKIHTVSNGRDTRLYTPGSELSRNKVRERLKIDVTAPLLIFAGSLGPKYSLHEMLLLFQLVRLDRSDARLLILTHSPEQVALALTEFPGLDVFVSVFGVPVHEVPEYLACADLGLALLKTTYSMQAVVAIKLGEYLLCGLPVVTSSGVGDTDVITEDTGYLIDGIDVAELKRAAKWFVEVVLPQRESFRTHCRAAGEKHFSLEASVNSYKDSIRWLNK